ncbi:hypothetical protein LXA43DRAFT_1094017 [Ganoderma leucocontextum]|nr:hypothetical protein LXA43DRAFT_1094017 [Ganoderma leucocontextum]
MPVFQITKGDYQIMSSIFKIENNTRYEITWFEFVKVMTHLGYAYSPGGHKGKGKTSGSRCRFISKRDGSVVNFHTPHNKKLEQYKQDDLKWALERTLGWSKSSFIIA